MKKIPGNLLKNLEKLWKYHGILLVQKSGNPDFSTQLLASCFEVETMQNPLNN